jgi:hypothetical protein
MGKLTQALFRTLVASTLAAGCVGGPDLVEVDEQSMALGSSPLQAAAGDHLLVSVSVARFDQVHHGGVMFMWGTAMGPMWLDKNPATRLLEGVLPVPKYTSFLTTTGRPKIGIQMHQDNGLVQSFESESDFESPSFTGVTLYQGKPQITNVTPTRIDAHTLEVAYDAADPAGIAYGHVTVFREYAAIPGPGTNHLYVASDSVKRLERCESALRKRCHLVMRLEHMPEVIEGTPVLEIRAVNNVGEHTEATSPTKLRSAGKAAFAFSWPSRPADPVASEKDLVPPTVSDAEFVAQDGRNVHLRFRFSGGKFDGAYGGAKILDKPRYKGQLTSSDFMLAKNKFKVDPSGHQVDVTFELPAKLYSRNLEFDVTAVAVSGASAIVHLQPAAKGRIRTDVIELDPLGVELRNVQFRKATASEIRAAQKL